MTSPRKLAPKWTDEERCIIARYQVNAYALQGADFQKLQAELPGRDSSQISDQYRRIVKPHILTLYPSGSSSASPQSTPAKKRKGCKVE